MARKAKTTLTELELEFMKQIWENAPYTAQQIRRQLEAEGRSLTESTVRTMLRILEQKGYLTHDVEGRTFRYRPRVERDGATASLLRDVLNRAFGGSPFLLVKSLLNQEEVSETELEQIKELIAEKEQAHG